MIDLIEWRKHDLKRIHKDLSEWKQELAISKLMFDIRKQEELLNQIWEIPNSIGKLLLLDVQYKSLDMALTRLYNCATLGRKQQRNMRITDDQIERAREYDISLLFPDAKNNMVSCYYHEDKRPSASIKRGYYKCFSCGERADSIKVLMDRDGLSFEDAVLRLG